MRTSEKLLELSLHLPRLAVVHRDFLKDAGMLELRSEDFSLVTLADTIARLGYLLHLAEQLVIPQEHAQRLLKVGEFEVSHFELFNHRSAYNC